MLLALTVFAQDEQLLTIKGFKGLNTKASDFVMQPNESRFAHEIDWGRNLGTPTKRLGYDLYGSVSGSDSIIGMYGAYFSDGTQRLFIVTDSSDVGYGSIWVTPENNALTFEHIDTICFQMITSESNTMRVILGEDSASKLYTAGEDLIATIDSLKDSCSAFLSGLTSADTGQAVFGGCGDAATDSSCTVLILTYTLNEGQSPATMEIEGHGKGTGLNACVQWRHYAAINSWELVSNKFSVQNRPSFATYGDIVYISNGDQNVIRWDGKSTLSYPPVASGVPRLIPILQGSGELDGEYIYSFLQSTSPSNYFIAPLAPRVRVENGRVIADQFWWHHGDSATTTPDTLKLKVYRTKGNPGAVKKSTYLFYTGQTITFALAGDSAIATKVHVDSIADASLSSDSVSLYSTSGRFARSAFGPYGAPSQISKILGDSVMTTGVSGANSTIPNFAGWGWWITVVDTVAGVESDTSRGTFYADADSTLAKVLLSIPLIPGDISSDLAINIYRAPYEVASWDSAQFFNPEPFQLPIWIWRFWADTIILSTPLRFVAQISSADTSFQDTVSWTTLQTTRSFTKSSAPGLLDNVTSFENRLWGMERSNVWYSDLLIGIDTLQRWGQLNLIPINRDDGDEGTLLYPARDYLRYYKNNSGYIIPPLSGGGYGRRIRTGDFGCIAPKSFATGLGSRYYLSGEGVIRESDGKQLDNTVDFGLVSDQLDNLDNLSLAIRRGAVGFYHDHKYMLSVPAVDTIYVYDERAGAWSTWGYSFGGATKYGVEVNARFVPGDTMYFFKQGGNDIFRYGTSELDNESAISIQWKSGPLLIGPNEKQITKLGLWVQSEDFATDRFYIRIKNESGTTVDSVFFSTLNGKRYHLKGASPTSQAIFFTVEATTVFNQTLDNTVIDAIDIFWKPVSGQTKQF